MKNFEKTPFILQVLLFLLSMQSNMVVGNAQTITASSDPVCANTWMTYSLTGFTCDNENHLVAYYESNDDGVTFNRNWTAGSTQVSFDNNGNGEINGVFWINDCAKPINKVKVVVSGFSQSNCGYTEKSLTIDLSSLGKPGCITGGPSTLPCGLGTTFDLSVTPGKYATTHNWTGIPSSWAMVSNDPPLNSSISVTVPVGDCNNNVKIDVSSARSDCSDLICFTPCIKTLKRDLVTPNFASNSNQACTAGQQFTLAVVNPDPSYLSYLWSVTGNLIIVGSNNSSTVVVETTSSPGTGEVFCTISDRCCHSKKFLVDVIYTGKPVLTYIDFSENFCPEFRVETDLIPADHYYWKWYKEPFSGFYNQKTTTANSTKLILSGGPAYYRIAVSSSGVCGLGNEIFRRFFVECEGGGGGHRPLMQIGNSDLDVYPNPASEEIAISINHAVPSDGFSIRIYDAQGRVAYSEEHLMENNLKISKLGSPGVYVVRVDSNQEDYHESKQVIIQ